MKIKSFVKYKDQILVLHNGFDSELIATLIKQKNIKSNCFVEI